MKVPKLILIIIIQILALLYCEA